MSDTPKEADDVMKLLDNQYSVVLFKNQLGSYTAVACKGVQSVAKALSIDRQNTDDFTPSQALYRLTEKVLTGRIA